MSYCADKDKATVIYRFKDKLEKRYVIEQENLPVEVRKENIKRSSGVITSFNQDYDGEEITTHDFTIEAPSDVPSDVEVEAYLISGTWDDHGSIGSYSTGYGIVTTFEGEPILIGTSRSINGTVTNEQPVHCYVQLQIDWRYEDGCKLVVSHKGNILYEEEGECPLEFNVVCDDDCPPGYLKCKSDKYPGYCCLPCKETAFKIQNLGAKI